MNQLVLPCYSQLVPENVYPIKEALQRISLIRHLGELSVELPRAAEPKIEDYFHTETQYLRNGLFVEVNDPRYNKAQHQIITVGVNRRYRGPHDFGVVFPSNEYSTVGRNPHDFAKHTVNKTRNARAGNEDREEDTNAAMRSAGHGLIAKMTTQKQLGKRWQEELDVLRVLRGDIKAPALTTRYQRRNIDRRRALADEKIHETVEIAGAIGMGLGNVAVSGMHNATRKRLYNGNYSSAEFGFNWLRMLSVVGIYQNEKIHKLAVSHDMCAKELKEYKPYLEAKERERAAIA